MAPPLRYTTNKQAATPIGSHQHMDMVPGPARYHNTDTPFTLPRPGGGSVTSSVLPAPALEPALNPDADCFISIRRPGYCSDSARPAGVSAQSTLDKDAPCFYPEHYATWIDYDVWVPLDVLDLLEHAALVDDVAAPHPCECHRLPIGSCPVFIKDDISLVQSVRAHPGGLPNMDGAKCRLENTDMDPAAWNNIMGSYYDKAELVDGIVYGWDLSLLPNPEPRDCHRNHPSATQFAADVDKYVQKELEFGALIGPFEEDDLPFQVFASPLGTVPKAMSEVRRTITDCSQREAGINHWISAHAHRGQHWQLRLPGTKNIVEQIARVRARYPGQKIKMFKLDLSRYYRFFRVDPSQWPFLAIRWRGKIYIDKSFSFGNRGAMLGAQRSSNAVSWNFRTQIPPSPHSSNSGLSCECRSDCFCGDNECIAYVDDLLAVAPAEFAEFLFSSLIALIKKLGLQPSTSTGHIVPPSDVCIGLGVEFDLVRNTVSLPAAKLASTLELLHQWIHRSQATKRELQSLCGKLLHCSRVVTPGRLHLNRMLNTQKRASILGTPVPLDSNFRADLQWWIRNLSNWNGISILEFTPTVAMVTVDASKTGWYNEEPGLGAFNFNNGEYFKCGVPAEYRDLHINNLELLVHIVCGNVWGPSWQGLEIPGKTDNEATELFLRHGRSPVDIRLAMGRTFTEMQHRWSFRWIPGRISTEDNILADCLSRWPAAARQEQFWRHCESIGITPIERLVTTEMFNIATI